MTAFLIVGYRCAQRPGSDKYAPEIIPPKNYGTDKAKEYTETKLAEFQQSVGSTPYFGRLEEVAIIDPLHERFGHFKPWTSTSKSGKKNVPVAVDVADWILEKWAGAFPDDPFAAVHPPAVSFIGFEPRRFLKLLGLDCAIDGNPLPATMWFGNSDHRDVWEAMLPGPECKIVPLQVALELLQCAPGPNYTPGVNVLTDTSVVANVAAALGVFGGAPVNPELLEDVEDSAQELAEAK